MTVEELDITPDIKNIQYQETQFSSNHSAFVTHVTKYNDDGLEGLITMHIAAVAPPTKQNVIISHSISLHAEEARELISILLHSINYLKEKK